MRKDRGRRLFFVGLLLSTTSLISLFAASIWQFERVNNQALQQAAHALALAQLQTLVAAATHQTPILPVVRQVDESAIKTLSFQVIRLSQPLDGFADEARRALWADPDLVYYSVRRPDMLLYAAIVPSGGALVAESSLFVLQVNLVELRVQAPMRYGDFIVIFALVVVLFGYGVFLIWSKP